MFKVCKILAFVYWIAKKLHCRCSTRSWIPIPLTLMMHQSPCSCAFIVGFQQILYIGLHEYLTHFRNPRFHCFKQINAIWEWYQKLEKIDPWFLFENSTKFRECRIFSYICWGWTSMGRVKIIWGEQYLLLHFHYFLPLETANTH